MYTLFINERDETDRGLIRLMKEKEGKDGTLRMFGCQYTAPYEPFVEILNFQKVSAYRPFKDSLSKKKVIAIDLKEWIGHENEEYLHIFFKFLHDAPLPFAYEYIFTVGGAGYEEAKPLHALMKKYLEEGEVYHYEA